MSYKYTTAKSLRAVDLLEKALSLIDPPSRYLFPEARLSAEKVAQAHDMLLEAAAIFNDVPFPQSSSDTHIAIVQDISVITDVYRCILVSCHLLLEMAAFGADSEYSAYPINHFDSIQKKNFLPFLTFQDETTLRQTINRCIYILQALSFLHTGSKTKPTSKHTVVSNWHDECLPHSQYRFIQLCFEGPDRLITLNLHPHLPHHDSFHYQQVIHQDLEPTFSNNAHENTVQNYNYEIDLPSNHLDEEESFLLDIAFPNPSTQTEFKTNYSHLPDSKFKTQHDQEANQMTTPKNVPYIIHEGWLNYKITNPEKKTTQIKTHHTKLRVYCKFYQCGLLHIIPQNHKNHNANSPISLPYLLAITEHSICAPVILGRTFHFRLKYMQTIFIQENNNHVNVSTDDDDASFLSRLHTSTSSPINHLFEIDEESGGGLSDGFTWVTVFQHLIESLCERNQLQNRIKCEWEHVGQWTRAGISSVKFFRHLLLEDMEDNPTEKNNSTSCMEEKKVDSQIKRIVEEFNAMPSSFQ